MWYSPICDTLFAKVSWWHGHYGRGEVYATRQFLDPIEGLVDKPVGYAHQIAFTAGEFDHLLRILRAKCQDQALIEEFERVRLILPRSRMILGKQHVVKLAFYQAHVQMVYDILLEAKTGVKQTTVAEQLEQEGKLF